MRLANSTILFPFLLFPCIKIFLYTSHDRKIHHNVSNHAFPFLLDALGIEPKSEIQNGRLGRESIMYCRLGIKKSLTLFPTSMLMRAIWFENQKTCVFLTFYIPTIIAYYNEEGLFEDHAFLVW